MTQSNSIKAQHQRLLLRLQQGACSTLQLRHEEDILAPAPRIFELRHYHGHNIVTHWTTASNPGGRVHRVAKYVLLPGKWQGENK